MFVIRSLRIGLIRGDHQTYGQPISGPGSTSKPHRRIQTPKVPSHPPLSISKAGGKRAFAAHTRITDRYTDMLLSGERQMSNDLAELVRLKSPIST
jgi:hypothetical protein